MFLFCCFIRILKQIGVYTNFKLDRPDREAHSYRECPAHSLNQLLTHASSAACVRVRECVVHFHSYKFWTLHSFPFIVCICLFVCFDLFFFLLLFGKLGPNWLGNCDLRWHMAACRRRRRRTIFFCFVVVDVELEF